MSRYRLPAALAAFAFGMAATFGLAASDPNCAACSRYCESNFYWCINGPGGDFDTCYTAYRACYDGCGCPPLP